MRHQLTHFKALCILCFLMVLLIIPFSGISQGAQLPFSEDWESGSFGSFWLHEENWLVNGQVGNSKPSAEFKWSPVLSNYSESLISGDINGIWQDSISNPFIDGHFILEFDVKLISVNSTGDEKIYIDIWADTSWISIKILNNSEGGFDWMHKEIDITNIAFGKMFKLRFLAEGSLSSDIISWHIDNISIERVCYPPSELSADYYDSFTVGLNWEPPYDGASANNWIMWDDGVNTDAIGLTGGGVFSIASHWDPDMLEEYMGRFIEKIRFFVYPNVVNTIYTLKVWEGPDAVTLLHEQELYNLIVGEWNTITLDASVQIDVSKELWFGYTVDQPDGENPAGCDGGPAVVGYGDMIALDGITWEPITNYGFDLNWNIQALISAVTDKHIAQSLEEDLSAYTENHGYQLAPSNSVSYKPVRVSTYDTIQYHVYYSDDGAPYEFVGETMDTSFYHVINIGFPIGHLPCYYVKAVFDDCDAISNEACAIGGPGTVGDFKNSNDVVSVYPNPVIETTCIKSEHPIRELYLLDLNGRNIFCRDGLNEKEVILDVSTYEPGLYLLRIDTEKGRVVRKVVVTE